MSDHQPLAILTENLRGGHISGYITYLQLDDKKVNDIFMNRGSKFYKGEYSLHATKGKFNCLLKKMYKEDKYHLVKHICHQNVIRPISYDCVSRTILVEYMENFGTFESYWKKNRHKLVDDSGKLTKKFKNFIRMVLTTLQFLYEESLAHGYLEAKNIYVWEQDEEDVDLSLKLFEIGVHLVGDRNFIKRARYDDFQKLGNLIRTVVGDNPDPCVTKFCEYLESGKNYEATYAISVNDVLNHPIFKIVTLKNWSEYIEKIIETQHISWVNKLRIEWLEDDDETILRKDISAEITENPYTNDSWSFIRLLRNSVKHYDKYDGTHLGLVDPYAYLRHVITKRPGFMFHLYNVIGDVSGICY